MFGATHRESAVQCALRPMHGLHDAPLRLDHEILVLDAYLREPLPQATREQDARSFIRTLLEALGMEELGPFQFYDAADLRAPGWSFLQPITTSHIGAHYFEKPGRLPHIRLDIYSCKQVDWRKVIEVTDTHLHLEDWRASFIHRGIEGGRMVQDIQGTGPTVIGVDIIQETTDHRHSKPIEHDIPIAVQ